MKNVNLVILIFCLCLCQAVFCQIEITNSPPLTADELVQKIAGSGVKVFNASMQCPNDASGYFFNTSTDSGLEIKSGVLLTTGTTAVALSPNTTGSASSNNGGGSYEPLEEFPWAYNGTFDACVLEFDFIPSGNEISLNYVFGSEEYPEYVGSSYNDTFAIIIEGGTEYPSSLPIIERSISIIPSTIDIHVAINFLNLASYNEFYIDNSGSIADDYVQYDGLTVALPATATVTPCQTYHLTLAIADVTDAIYDSGIFIEENSFSKHY